MTDQLKEIDAKTARQIAKVFTEVVIAPDADPEARAILAKKTGLRLLQHAFVDLRAPWYPISDDLPQHARAPARPVHER